MITDTDWPLPRPIGQYLSPNCRTALLPGVPDDWVDGHPKCGYPGYEHPILGFMAIPCTCPCHTDGSSA